MKHSPAPWRAQIARDARDHEIFSGTHMITAVINYDRANEHANRVRDQADAHLIAAAPELYAALNQIAEFNIDPQSEDFVVVMRFAAAMIMEMRGIARQAILKAESKNYG